MVWVDYGGQDVAGFDFIGTDTLRYPISEGFNLEETVEEIKRRCGRLARIKLFKKECENKDGNR